MNDPTLFKKYLIGEASDDEIQQCEERLKDPAFLASVEDDLKANPIHDSLVETIGKLGNETQELSAAHASARDLVLKLESLGAKEQFHHHALDQILDPAESPDELGRIAHYRVIEFIASGGMGLVFKAEDSRLQRPVCIKVLKPSLASNTESKARFEREVKAAAKLRNARITTVLEFGENRGLPYLVMELLDGMSLREKLNVSGKFSPDAAAKLTIQIAEGLRYAHNLGFLHRDIKPENIWVTPEGDAKLLDFGLAHCFEESTKLTQAGTILGTPNYMSPEQVQGNAIDARSDLFSVGSVFFEMLTGQSPFGKSNLFSTMMSVANETLVFPKSDSDTNVPESIQQVIEALLQKDPRHRLESADALINVLSASEHSRQKVLKSKGFAGIRTGLTGIFGAIAGALILGAFFGLWHLNNKGTLVVEADPAINVSIANEEVSIHDPETDERFKVTIGDHPLPSGVYQLQMSDPSGKYSLSSDVIVIRRGEKQIVRVELKPASTKNAITQ